MDSSEGNKRKTTDILVYERRRKGISSGKKMSYPNENISSHLEFSMAKTDASRKIGEDGSYFECELCYDGGYLLCCKVCPRTYHLECLDLKSVPKEEWRCPNCLGNEDLSVPMKHLKNLVSKEDIPSKKEKDGSCSSN